MGGESRSEATTAYSRQPETPPGKSYVIDPLWSYHHIAAERDIRDLQGGNFICIDGMEFSGPGNETHTIPTNLDFEAFHERQYRIGEYAINGGRLAYLDQYGRKFLGFTTDENIKALEQAGYKKGRVWVEFSHGEEPVRQEDKQKFRSWEAKERAQKLEPFILQGLELMAEGEFQEALDYFEDPKMAKAVGFDWGDARTMIIGPSSTSQQIQDAIDFCADNSHFDPLIKGTEEKPLITLANVTIRPKVDNPSARLYHNIALLHAEEWLHGLIFLRKKPLNEGLKIKNRRYSRTAAEVDIALYLQKHNVPMTDEFLDRYGKREELFEPSISVQDGTITGKPLKTQQLGVDLNVAAKTQEKIKPDIVEQRAPRKLTRRIVLKALGGVIGTVVLNKGWEKIIEIREEGSAEALRKQLEEQFNIDLSIRAYNADDEVWNKNHLMILKQSLSLLPDHFYKPGESGQKVGIWISQTSRSSCICGTVELDPLLPFLPKETVINNVDIGARELDTVEDLLPVLAHELTHRYQFVTWNKNSSDLPWYQRVEQILGGRWDSELTNRFIDRIKEKFPGITTLRGNSPFGTQVRKILGNTKEAFYVQFAYGFAADIKGRQAIPQNTPVEFVATLSQHYVEGKKYFFQAYTEFFPKETVEKLYNFVRDDIFRGREY